MVRGLEVGGVVAKMAGFRQTDCLGGGIEDVQRSGDLEEKRFEGDKKDRSDD